MNNILNNWAKDHPTAYFFLDLGINLFIILILVYLIRSYIVSPFQVFGPSMCDTLNNIEGECQNSFGDYLIVKKGSYRSFFGKTFGSPQRGDIIVFHPPIKTEEDYFIKRIIGLPGETVEIDDGKIYIYPPDSSERFLLEEPYLNEENRNNTQTHSGSRKVKYPVVPQNYYFVMGDNRRRSTDSRTCFTGSLNSCKDPINYFLPIKSIAGKSWFILWPFDKAQILRSPEYAEKPVK